MTISGGSALSKDEIDRMVKDAEAHADEDKKRREEAEARNNAEQLVYSTEKFLADNADKLPEDGRKPVDESLKDLKDALAAEGTSSEDISTKATTLSEESQKLGAALYAQQSDEGAAGAGAAGAGAAGGAAGAGQAKADDDVIDAEVVDDDTDKK